MGKMPRIHSANRPRVIHTTVLLAASILATASTPCDAFAFLSPPSSSWTHVVEHLLSPPLQVTPLEDLTNVRIPGPPGSDVDVLAYRAAPSDREREKDEGADPPALILLHEFFGLNPSVVEKAQALADELGCVVVAPDTFRGEVTDFIPRAIWLALTTPQERVDEDLDAVCSYLRKAGVGGEGRLAVMGFCYGGGKAIRYTTRRRTDAATVVFYGAPETDVGRLRRLEGPVCGVYGSEDGQFSKALLDKFRTALDAANVDSDVRIYDGVGHAFWTGMDQIRRGDQPQTEAYEQCTSFLQEFFSIK